MRSIFLSVISFTLAFLIATQLMAQEAPDVLLKNVTQEMISALRENDKNLQEHPEHIYKIIDQILVPHIDWNAMARWVVGRAAWESATQVQRDNFAKEFRDLLIRTYASTLRAYNNQTIDYLPIRGGIGDKNRVQVTSLIRESGREPIRVTYRLINQSGNWLVYDIIIEGVSLLKGFQSQFAQELQQKGLDAVTQRLHQHNEKPLR